MSVYNPYNDAYSILSAKRGWTNARAKNEDPTAFEKEAEKYYEQLRHNGRDDVADKLAKSDLLQAEEYIKSLEPSDDVYTPDYESIQRKSNNVYNTGKAYGSEISKSYDKVYDNNINIDPLSTGWGKEIMSGYGAASERAYNKTLGAGIEDAGGNADSYAAANANRQQAAVLSQGYGDVLAYYDAISGKASDWANNKASALGTNLAQLQENVSGDRASLSEKAQMDLQRYLGELGYETDRYVTDKQTGAQIHASDNELEASKHVSDNDLEASTHAADVAAAADQYGAMLDYNLGYLKQQSSGSSGSSGSGSSNSGSGNAGADAGREFVATLSQIYTAAQDGARDALGKVDPDKFNANIQSYLDNEEYSLSARRELANYYADRTGIVLTPKQRSQTTQAASSPTVQTSQTPQAGQTAPQRVTVPHLSYFEYNRYLSDLMKEPNVSAKQTRVAQWLKMGLLNEDDAAQMLKTTGAYTPDLG